MPKPNLTQRLRVQLTSEGQDIDVQNLLKSLTAVVQATQKNLDKKQLNVAQEFSNSTGTNPLTKQLRSLINFRRYAIADLSVEFGVIEDKRKLPKDVRTRFRLAQDPPSGSRVRQASITVSGGDEPHAEFRIDGELTAAVD